MNDLVFVRRAMSDPDNKSTFEIVGQEPHAWLMEATQLKRAADLVGQELAKKLAVSPYGRPRYEDIVLFKSYMLLSGLALENLAKGIIVGRNPGVVTPDTFNLKGHNLLQLAQQAALPFSDAERDILDRLTAFVVWAGKYPIHLQATKNVHPPFMHTDLELIDRLFVKFGAILEGEHPTSTNVKFV
jgi:hypothetical protein